MGRQASVIVCDDVLYNMNGKAFLNGIYSGDIVIAADPTNLTQLIFYFIAETDLSEPFTSLFAEITLPGGPTIRSLIPSNPPLQLSGRSRLVVKWPIALTFPVLRPGKISIKLIHESGELPVFGPWIVYMQLPSGTETPH